MGFQKFSRPVRMLIVAGGSLLALGALLLVCLGLHYRNTPTFEEYVRTRPVSRESAQARWPEAELLSTEQLWREGEVDPFAILPDDPGLRVHSLSATSVVRHGDEVVAEVLQELAVAADRASGDRRGSSVRTTLLRIHPGMRALARTWIGGAPLLGPGSQARGSASFDVVVVAGAGAFEASVARMPAQSLAPLVESFAATGPGDLFAEWLNPRGRLDGAGLIHHLRQEVFLMWSVSPGNASSAGWAPAHAWTSVGEYSYAIEQGLKDSTGSSHSSTHSVSKSFNGRVW